MIDTSYYEKLMIDATFDVPASIHKELASENSLYRGFSFGYVAERKFMEHLKDKYSIDNAYKPKDRDHTHGHCDCIFDYQGQIVRIQIKSIGTPTIKYKNNKLWAHVSNDGSDKRNVTLPNGDTVHTCSYVVDGYDILAVPTLLFTEDWNFVYKLNRNCRRKTHGNFTEEQKQYLLATSEEICWPLNDEWSTDLIETIKELRNDRPVQRNNTLNFAD